MGCDNSPDPQQVLESSRKTTAEVAKQLELTRKSTAEAQKTFDASLKSPEAVKPSTDATKDRNRSSATAGR